MVTAGKVSVIALFKINSNGSKAERREIFLMQRHLCQRYRRVHTGE
jgi:hypothetical protein